MRLVQPAVLLWYITLVQTALPIHGGEITDSSEERLARRALVILQEKCAACHGLDADAIRGGFSVLTREDVLRGGDSGEPALIPGKPDESPLYHAVQRTGWAMPPKENDKLTAEQVEIIRNWITGGAPWPDNSSTAASPPVDTGHDADGVFVETSGGLTVEWTERRYPPEHLWPYQPLSSSSAPAAIAKSGHSIDGLIAKHLDAKDLFPAPPADRRTLIRRATFDLLGLPPTPEEIDEFVGDDADDQAAFARVAERLLSSPHYGEQWGRHWLDVVRYADSSGYANDYERGNAWRYRDYVVRAFNEDKPYDDFIREQLAGDEIDPSNPELLVAAGFLRMGPWELTAMEVPKVARQRFLDDVTDAVGQVFMAHMLQCARCHDHKFDPVPTRDYYSIQAAFATTQLAEREAPFLAEENTSGFEERDALEQRRQFYQQTKLEIEHKQTIEASRQWLVESGGDTTEFDAIVSDLQDRSHPVTVDRVRELMQERKVHPDLIPPRSVGLGPDDLGLLRVAFKGLERLRWRLDRYEPVALSVYDGLTPVVKSVNAPRRMPENSQSNGELEQTCLLQGGDVFSPGEGVVPGTLSAVNSLAGSLLEEPRIPDQIEGRRLTLANWIASESNPLTARVMVNRIWQGHFGRAIAGNPNNFGTTGAKPSHPELLDWLAAEFIREGWSIKAMHRLIMSSRAYQRSSHHPDPETLAAKDPDASSYAVFPPRRLDAEEIRDAMLHVSGELNPAIGGIPVRPEMNPGAALQPRAVMGTVAEAWQPSPLPQQRHRRSIYGLKLRGLRDPFLEVFNAPSPDLSCEAREASTITPQVFALFNSERSFDRALALANRVHSEELDRSQAIERLYRLVYGRSPVAEEAADCLAHWERMTARHASLHFDPPQFPTEVLREAVEENTGETFAFLEPLEVAAEFIPDLKPADVSPEMRGLAEVCLVLLNSNEFLYVY
ncbi:MAG: PSD1 and planctomycete cytochrome C domain-containing protein [Planctomycetaceae bacterium]